MTAQVTTPLSYSCRFCGSFVTLLDMNEEIKCKRCIISERFDEILNEGFVVDYYGET